MIDVMCAFATARVVDHFNICFSVFLSYYLTQTLQRFVKIVIAVFMTCDRVYVGLHERYTRPILSYRDS